MNRRQLLIQSASALSVAACAPVTQQAGLPDALFGGPSLEDDAIISFDGDLIVGVLADAKLVTDPRFLLDRIEQELRDCLAVTTAPRPPVPSPVRVDALAPAPTAG